MKGETIPDQNHIARFCRPMQVDEGQIQAAAFMLRADEESLSVIGWNFSTAQVERVKLPKFEQSTLKHYRRSACKNSCPKCW